MTPPRVLGCGYPKTKALMVADTTAADLIEQARAANSLGRPATAEQMLRRAIRTLSQPGASLDDLRLRGAAIVALASPIFERRGLDPALAVLDEADDLVRGPAGDGVRALSSIQRAGFLARGGEWRIAVELLSTISPTNPWLSKRQLVSVHLNRATARQYLGDLSRCLADLHTALDLAAAADCPDLEFKARHNLGYTRFLTGDVPGALRAMGEADRMDVDVARATAKRDYARVLLESGLTDEAAPLLHDALTIAAELRLHHEVGEVLVDTARLELMRGRPEQARAAAARAARLFRRRAADGWWVQAEILRDEAALARGTTRAGARQIAATLQDLPTHSRVIRVDALLVATDASLAAGDLEQARRLFGEARGAPLSPAGRLRRDWLAARLALAAGDRPRARRRLREAADRMAEQQDRPASIDTRTAFALHAQRLVTFDVRMAVDSGSPHQVLAATERWRAATSRLPSLVPRDDEELAELFTRLRSLRSQLRDTADAALTDELTGRIQEQERAIRRREWELADRERTVRLRRPARAADALARAAATDTDVLSLLAVDDRLRAVTISADGARLHDLGDAAVIAEQTRRLLADVAMAGRRLSGALPDVVARSLTRRLDDLAALLPIPRTRSRLLIVTTRVLRSVPWRLVPGIADRPVVVSRSLSSWLAGAPQHGSSPTATALAGPGLGRAVAEVDAVARSWSDNGAGLPHATGADLTRALLQSDVVHVAAHGHHHEQNALFSSLAMTDGPLFAYELQRRGVRSAHVVLSACDTGRAMMRPGDEEVGLASSLLACGASSVVAAVAPVEDTAAAELMATYHRSLAAGVSSSVALQLATAASDKPRQAGLFCTYGADWSAGPSDPVV